MLHRGCWFFKHKWMLKLYRIVIALHDILLVTDLIIISICFNCFVLITLPVHGNQTSLATLRSIYMYTSKMRVMSAARTSSRSYFTSTISISMSLNDAGMPAIRSTLDDVRRRSASSIQDKLIWFRVLCSLNTRHIRTVPQASTCIHAHIILPFWGRVRARTLHSLAKVRECTNRFTAQMCFMAARSHVLDMKWCSVCQTPPKTKLYCSHVHAGASTHEHATQQSYTLPYMIMEIWTDWRADWLQLRIVSDTCARTAVWEPLWSVPSWVRARVEFYFFACSGCQCVYVWVCVWVEQGNPKHVIAFTSRNEWYMKSDNCWTCEHGPLFNMMYFHVLLMNCVSGNAWT